MLPAILAKCNARHLKCFKCHAIGRFSKFCPRSRRTETVDAVQILSVSKGDEVCQVSRDGKCPYYGALVNQKRLWMLVDTAQTSA